MANDILCPSMLLNAELRLLIIKQTIGKTPYGKAVIKILYGYAS